MEFGGFFLRELANIWENRYNNKNETDWNVFKMKEKRKQDSHVVWGRVVIPLIPGGEAGWCYYSDEINHELGDGLLWIDYALEQPEGAMLFGSASAFEDSEYLEEPLLAEVGILLSPDRKSFRVGIKLLADTDQKEAVVYWRAGQLKRSEAERKLAEDEKTLLGYYMTAKRPVVQSMVVEVQEDAPEAFYIQSTPKYLYKGQKFMFSCKVPEGTKEPVTWKVLGEDAGTIDSYGMYTAPDHQGVFQVEASLGSHYRTTVYVMIKDQEG